MYTTVYSEESIIPRSGAAAAGSNMRKPASPIRIFHSTPLGNTANTIQTYRLIKSLKVLRTWVDVEFRMWWDKVLGVDGAFGE